jgi:hypothetical protein
MPTAELSSTVQPLLGNCELVTIPTQVVAVMECVSDDDVANKAEIDRQLREALLYDGIIIVDPDNSNDKQLVVGRQQQQLLFANYDFGFDNRSKYMGEVWITLTDACHPWSN